MKSKKTLYIIGITMIITGLLLIVGNDLTQMTSFAGVDKTSNIKIIKQDGKTDGFTEGDKIFWQWRNPPDEKETRTSGDGLWIDGKLCRFQNYPAKNNQQHFSEKTFLEFGWGNGIPVRDCTLEAGIHYIEVIAGTSSHPLGGGISLRSPFYHYGIEINVKALPCVYDSDQTLVVESFRDGSKITKSDLSFPFVKFCGAHQPLITDAFTKSSYSSSEVLSQLKNDVTITVPPNKVYSIFYVATRTKDIPSACDVRKAFNPETKTCEDVIGFVTVCREGYYDSSAGVCNTFPDLKYICPEGSILNVKTNECIITKEVVEKIVGFEEIICPENTIRVESDNMVKCLKEGKIVSVCPAGATLSEGVCESQVGGEQIVDADGFGIDWVLLFGRLLFVLGVVLIITISTISLITQKGRKK